MNDAPLYKTSDYIIETSSPNFLSFGYDEVDEPILFPLDESGNGELRSGDYHLTMYVVAGK